MSFVINHVSTQDELDQALADHSDVICIDSDPGVWLSVADSGSSRVVASGSSHVITSGSVRIEAWDSSRVEARDSSHVVARGFSHVVAGKYVAVHQHSQHATLDAKGPVIDMTAVDLNDPATWCDYHAVFGLSRSARR